MTSADKLYIVTRSDLPAGYQAAQAVHAARQFQALHPDLERAWFERSNTIAILSAPSEEALSELASLAERLELRIARFHEPDIDNQLTAIAIEPGDHARRICRRLPLTHSRACA